MFDLKLQLMCWVKKLYWSGTKKHMLPKAKVFSLTRWRNLWNGYKMQKKVWLYLTTWWPFSRSFLTVIQNSSSRHRFFCVFVVFGFVNLKFWAFISKWRQWKYLHDKTKSLKLSLVEDKEEEIIRCERKKIITFMGLYQFFIVPLLVGA